MTSRWIWHNSRSSVYKYWTLLQNKAAESAAVRYGMAVTLAVLVFAWQYVLPLSLQQRLAFWPFLPAVFLAAWVGRLAPGLLVLALGWLLGDLLLPKPFLRIGSYGPWEGASLMVYLVSGALALWVIEIMHRTRAALGLARANHQLLERQLEDRELAQEALRQSEHRFRMLTTHCPVGIFLTNPVGACLYVNECWCELGGMTLEEAEGEGWMRALHPEDRERVCQEWFGTVAREQNFDAEFRFQTASGKSSWLHGQAVPLRNRAGGLTGFLGSVMDITARKEAQEAWRQSEARFRSIFDGAAIGMAMTDLQGYLLECNPAFLRMLGYSREQLKGMTIADITYAEDLELDLTLFREMVSGKREEFQIEKRYLRKAGGTMWGRLTASVLRDSAGTPQFAIKMVEDISARKLVESDLHQSEERYRLLVEQSPDAILVHREGIYLYANPAAVRLFGAASAADLVGRKVMDLVQADYRAVLADRMLELQTEGLAATPLIETKILRLDGLAIDVESTSRLIAYERMPAAQVIIRDITVRKEVERKLDEARVKLRAYADELEVRVEERTARLQESLESLEAVLYHVTHDLRAPLRAIQGYTEMVLREDDSALGSEQVDYLQRSYKASERMDHLIGDILEFGRVGYQKMAACRVKLSECIDQVLAGLESEVARKNARIVVRKPFPLVLADGPMLERILTNLVGNGLKFVPPERAPRIDIWAEEIPGRQADAEHPFIRLWIQDNGIGIAPEDQEKIFVPFERLDNASNFPGTGVGLSIVKKGLERMGGQIGVESDLGQGSRFWLELVKADSGSDVCDAKMNPQSHPNALGGCG